MTHQDDTIHLLVKRKGNAARIVNALVYRTSFVITRSINFVDKELLDIQASEAVFTLEVMAKQKFTHFVPRDKPKKRRGIHTKSLNKKN